MTIGIQTLYGNMIITSPQKELDLVFDTQSYMDKFFAGLGLDTRPGQLELAESSNSDEVACLTFNICNQAQQWGIWELQNHSTLDLFSYARLLNPMKTNIVIIPVLDIRRFSPLLSSKDNVDIRQKMLRGQKLHCEGRIISPIALYASHLPVVVVYISDVRQSVDNIPIRLDIPGELQHIAVTYAVSELANIQSDLLSFLELL